MRQPPAGSAAPVGSAGVAGDSGIVERGGAVQDFGTGDSVTGTCCITSATNDRFPSATTLTFSIRSSYRHSVARLEEFLTELFNQGQPSSGPCPAR